jgi:hypothetical protein
MTDTLENVAADEDVDQQQMAAPTAPLAQASSGWSCRPERVVEPRTTRTIEPRWVVGFRGILDAYFVAGMAAMGSVLLVCFSCAMEPSDR